MRDKITQNTNWESVIGLEIHVQLATKSKLFSGASTSYGNPPNTQVCPIDIGMPGTLPVVNQEVITMAIKFGLAIGAEISCDSQFARKNYFYPDLPKGYQISQFENPIVNNGSIIIQADNGGEKTITIQRAHLEEDAGKSLHDKFEQYTGIDLNRAGTPLLEVVSAPELSSAVEAVNYMKAIYNLTQYLAICDGNMQEGSFRCDANVSVRPKETDQLGTRTELKNINSFRFVEKAINYEINRHIELLENGKEIIQETRLYDPNKDETRSMRSKEEANDYRYFPDPDLPPLFIDEQVIDEIKSTLPELPQQKLIRFINDYQFTKDEAEQLVADKQLADYFEAMIKRLGNQHAKLSFNWLLGELASMLNKHHLTIEKSPVSGENMANLLSFIIQGSISGKIAKQVFAEMWETDKTASDIIKEKNLQQLSNPEELKNIINKIFVQFPEQLTEYKNGNSKVYNFFIGQMMKQTQGKANPKMLSELLTSLLSEK